MKYLSSLKPLVGYNKYRYMVLVGYCYFLNLYGITKLTGVISVLERGGGLVGGGSCTILTCIVSMVRVKPKAYRSYLSLPIFTNFQFIN